MEVVLVDQFDVIVLGPGAAALTAAVTAHGHGAADRGTAHKSCPIVKRSGRWPYATRTEWIGSTVTA